MLFLPWKVSPFTEWWKGREYFNAAWRQTSASQKKINLYCQWNPGQGATSGSREIQCRLPCVHNIHGNLWSEISESRHRNLCPCSYCGQVLWGVMPLVFQANLPVCSEGNMGWSPSAWQYWIWPVPPGHPWSTASLQDSQQTLSLSLVDRSPCVGYISCKFLQFIL